LKLKLIILRNTKNFNPEDPQFKDFEKLYDDLRNAVETKNYAEIKISMDKIDQIIRLASELEQKMPYNESEGDGNPQETSEKK